MKAKESLFVVAALLLTAACTGQKSKAPADSPSTVADGFPVDTAVSADSADTIGTLYPETPMPRAADELFDDFLFNFAASKKLQMERVAFPLPVTRNGKTTPTEKGNWRMDYFFMRQGYYTVVFDSEQQMQLMNDTSVNRATVEKIYFNTGAVQQYMFRRLRGAWMLVAVKTQPIADNRNASFLEFYHQFVTDSVFQLQSLAEPVYFSGPDPDDDFARMEGILTPDTWPAFAPELPQRMIYNIVYGDPAPPSHTKIFLLRGISNGLELDMTFRYSNERWLLHKLST